MDDLRGPKREQRAAADLASLLFDFYKDEAADTEKDDPLAETKPKRKRKAINSKMDSLMSHFSLQMPLSPPPPAAHKSIKPKVRSPLPSDSLLAFSRVLNQIAYTVCLRCGPKGKENQAARFQR